MVIFNMKWKKVEWNLIDKKYNGLKYSKNDQSKYNNNKHDMVVFYKIWKKYDEIQLTKNANIR